MISSTLSIRQALLSQDPSQQDAITRRLGAGQPHQELVAIASAIRSDCTTDPRRLTTQHLKRLLNATYDHLALLVIKTQAARIDIIEKAEDVASAATQWQATHDKFGPLEEHFGALCLEIKQSRERYDIHIEVSEVAA